MVKDQNFVWNRSGAIKKKGMFRTWYQPLQSLINSEYMDKLLSFMDKEYETSKYYMIPEQQEIFNSFRHCKYDDLKMVVITNVHTLHRGANGIGFGSKKGTDTANYMTGAFSRCIKETFYKHTNRPQYLYDETLEDYAKQGILFLNRSLTSRMTKCYKKVWKNFLREVIYKINEEKEKVVFVFLSDGLDDIIDFVDQDKHKVFANRNHLLEPDNRVLFSADDYIYDTYAANEQIEW